MRGIGEGGEQLRAQRRRLGQRGLRAGARQAGERYASRAMNNKREQMRRTRTSSATTAAPAFLRPAAVCAQRRGVTRCADVSGEATACTRARLAQRPRHEARLLGRHAALEQSDVAEVLW